MEGTIKLLGNKILFFLKIQNASKHKINYFIANFSKSYVLDHSEVTKAVTRNEWVKKDWGGGSILNKSWFE